MSKQSLKKTISYSVVLAAILLTATSSYALPQYQIRFSQDPFSRPELRGHCSTCHINPNGGGPRNPFGEAFEKHNLRSTRR